MSAVTINGEKWFSPSEVDAIRSDTWKAARSLTMNDFHHTPYAYRAFSDYLSSLNLNTHIEPKNPLSFNWDENKRRYDMDTNDTGKEEKKYSQSEVDSMLMELQDKYDVQKELLNRKSQPTNDNAFINDEFVKLFLMSNSIGDTQLNNWEKFKQSNHVPKQPTPEPSALPTKEQDNSDVACLSLNDVREVVNLDDYVALEKIAKQKLNK